MGQGTRKLLVPEYMQKFQCTGSECEDTCCSGWGIAVDKATYKKYNKVKDKSIATQLDATVKRNRVNPTDAAYANIKLNEKGLCPLLTEHKLCSVQQKLGESHLSDVCLTYPRVSNRINGTIEKAGTVSCPEIAKLVLLNPDGISFVEGEETDHTRNIFNVKMNTDHPTIVPIIEHYFWELRVFSIELLQNRNFSVQERLILLGLFYRRLQTLMENEPSVNPAELIGLFYRSLESGEFREQLTDIPVQVYIQMELLKELADQRFRHFINSRRYLDCYAEFLHGLGYTDTAAVDEITANYQHGYKSYYEPLMNQHEYILENYLVNYVFKHVFPVRRTESVFDEYILLVLHYSLVKLHLIGMAAFHKGDFNLEHVVKLIQSFGRAIEHNSLFFKDAFNLLSENGYSSMAYMSILIKN